MTERSTSRVSRDAIGLGGVAWAYLALRSGSVSGAPLSATGAALDTFRSLYMDGRSAVVQALGEGLGIISSEQAERTLPRTLPVSGPVTRNDITALAISILPAAALDHLNRRTAAASSYQGAAMEDIPGGAWGTDEELIALFSAAPGSESGLTAWWQRLEAIWPRGSSNAYARQMWWYVGVALGAPAASVASRLEQAYVSYVFADADPSAISATATVQQAAAAVVPPAAIPTGGSLTAPPDAAVELDPTVITARASGRSIWEWLVIAFGFGTVGVLSWYIFFARRRNTKPWRRR